MNRLVRETHRWASIAFTIVVVINGIAVKQGKYNNKLGLLAVAVLAVQFFSGMYLFVLPYLHRWQGRTRLEEHG